MGKMDVTYRPPPALLPFETPEGTLDKFRSIFQPGGSPRRIDGPAGRVLCCSQRNLGAYQGLYTRSKPRDSLLGSPFHRLPWVEDTLQNPDEIWQIPENRASTEIFVSRYRLSDGRRILFLVRCHTRKQSEEVLAGDPFTQEFYDADRDKSTWEKRILTAKKVWPTPVVAVAVAPPPGQVLHIRVAVFFGSAEREGREQAWRNRLLQLEAEQSSVRFEAEFYRSRLPDAGFDYWILDEKTVRTHQEAESVGFLKTARSAKLIWFSVRNPAKILMNGTQLALIPGLPSVEQDDDGQ